jgi:dTDP-4-amino-4,6-dideoxygalactose transaminase
LALARATAPTLAEVENAYGHVLGAPAVVLFPSARAAIHVVLRATLGMQAPVVCPAYTCDVVHQALDLLRARTHYVDTAAESFLMSPADIGSALEPESAVILSEIYGMPYDADAIDGVCPGGERLRIFDLAMCIPSPARVGRLNRMDVALYSFGWGKPMYAGWGALACFQDAEFAEQTRIARDKWMGAGSQGDRRLHELAVLLRVMLNQRLPHGIIETPFARSILAAVRGWNRGQKWGGGFDSEASSAAQPVLPYQAVDEASRFSVLPAEWTVPPGGLDRKLSIHNLPHLGEHAELRRAQAQTYWSLLVEPGLLRGPAPDALPQSHFPVRIPGGRRDAFRAELRHRGIDTTILFSLPPGLDPSSYPNAASSASVVATLPMGPALRPDEVPMIAACARQALSAAS